MPAPRTALMPVLAPAHFHFLSVHSVSSWHEVYKRKGFLSVLRGCGGGERKKQPKTYKDLITITFLIKRQHLNSL